MGIVCSASKSAVSGQNVISARTGPETCGSASVSVAAPARILSERFTGAEFRRLLVNRQYLVDALCNQSRHFESSGLFRWRCNRYRHFASRGLR